VSIGFIDYIKIKNNLASRDNCDCYMRGEVLGGYLITTNNVIAFYR